MQNIENHIFNILFIKEIGVISEKKAKKLASIDHFTVHQFNPGENIQLIEKETQNMVIITPQHVSYVPSPVNNEFILHNSSPAIKAFKIISETLLIEDPVIQVALERSYESKYNTFEKSLSLFNNPEPISTATSSKAIGLRIPFQREIIFGDIKIEPFFQNEKRYFLGCRIQTVKEVNESEMEEVLTNMFRMIYEELEPLVHNLFN